MINATCVSQSDSVKYCDQGHLLNLTVEVNSYDQLLVYQVLFWMLDSGLDRGQDYGLN